MPSVNLKPNGHNNGYYVSVDVEAAPAEDGEPAGLAVDVDNNNNGQVSIFETDADAIRELRDLVVAECNKALELAGEKP